MLERDAGNDQSELVLLARLRQIGNARPELVHRDVEFVDGDHQVDKQTIDHLLDAQTTVPLVEPGGTAGKSGDHVLLDQICWHVSVSSVRLVSACRTNHLTIRS